MELTTEFIIFGFIILILISLLFYLLFQLNLKKSNGKTLSQKLSNLSKEIHERQNCLSDIKTELEEKKMNFIH